MILPGFPGKRVIRIFRFRNTNLKGAYAAAIRHSVRLPYIILKT